MLTNIQVLRAIAALLVVHCHAAGPAGLDLRWDGGAHGVDLFFVISGFIIAHVAAQDSHQFFVRRLIRIVPIYWLTTLTLFALVIVLPSLFRSTSTDPELLVRSLLFLPMASSVHADGIPHPTLSVGWTLNYEMYFYVVFALALVVSPRHRDWIACAFLIAIVAITGTVGLGGSPVAEFYGKPIILEFMFGIVAFHLMRYLREQARAGRFTPPPKAVLIGVAALGMGAIAFSTMLFGDAPRWLVAGVPAFFTLLAVLILEELHGARVTNRFAILVGDASYVLYLIHAYIVYGALRLVFRGWHPPELVGQGIALVLMFACAIGAVIAYRVIELPLLRFLKRRVVRSKSESKRV